MKERILNYKLSLLYRFARLFPDGLFLKLLFPLRTGYKLNLKAPQTFNEKLQWLKLYDRNPEYSKMVDKVEAKKYVADIIGDDHIIPTLAVYDKVEDIDFDTLPDRFVLKCTHDSGGIVICKDKATLDKQAAIEKLRRGLEQNYFYQNREWPYKNVKPRIIAEVYMDGGEELLDYKFMCYNGVCKNLFVCTGRAKHDLRVDFFDTKWQHLPFYRKYPNADYEIPKPENLDEMILCANDIASKVRCPFVRIDLYSINGKIYFGEITFFPGSGMEFFEPIEWDYTLGSYINLPK